MEFSSAIYRGDPCPEFSFSFKLLKINNTSFALYKFLSDLLHFRNALFGNTQHNYVQ